ncbi:patatin-like phospholipase family protein [Bradyrhizobium cenepequi]
MFLWMDMLACWSPYQTNPWNYHPLRALLERIDFKQLQRDQDAPHVFIGATNVRNGLRRVFDNGELTVDVLLASACLPLVYQAVEIGGEHYWDGGYTGNPPLAPLYLRTTATDVVIIGINPLLRADVPRSAREIISRIDEISFNSAFTSELAAIAFIEHFFEPTAARDRVRRMFVHLVNDKELDALGASSKMNNNRAFLGHLRNVGWIAAEHWLAANRRFCRRALNRRLVGAPSSARWAIRGSDRNTTASSNLGSNCPRHALNLGCPVAADAPAQDEQCHH